MVATFSKFYDKIGLVFVLTLENAFLRDFVFKPTETAQVLLKNSTRDFQNIPPLERSACFYVTISENFEHFQYFNFRFSRKRKLFSKNWSTVFQLNALILKRHHFYTKQIGQQLQNGPITENGVLPVTTFFLKVLFQFKNLL